MTSRQCRLIAAIVPLLTGAGPHLLRGQTASRLDAGAGAGGSAFGWQPTVGVAGSMQALSLGGLALSWQGALDRVAARSVSRYELMGGARLSTAAGPTGWWLGASAVRRNGFKEAVERPRIETGGWRRLGDVVLTLSAARRSATMSGLTRFTRSVSRYSPYQDSITGRWDSTLVTSTVGDSARTSELRRWDETEAGLAWEGRRLSAAAALGGRLASRGVPRGVWATATLAVRLSSPLSLVAGAGTASGAGFALDGERRFVTIGLRIRPPVTPPLADRHAVAAAMVSSFDVEPAGAGRYRLTITAPGAHRVELSGDFTSWKPVALAPIGTGRWSLTLPLAGGTHRLNARVDGGSWIVPPGLTTMSDDFAGEVGLLVIERAVDGKSAEKKEDGPR